MDSLFVVTDQRRRGAQVFASELGSALRDRGRNIRTVALADSPPAGDQPRIDAPTLGRRRLGAGTIWSLRQALRGAATSVGFGSSTLPALAAAGLGTGVPFIYRSIGELPFWAGRLDRQLRVRLELTRADIVVVLWEAAATPVVERYGVAPSRVRVIPRGVDGRRFPPVDAAARAEARAALGVPADACVVAWVGALSSEKRPELAVRAMAHLPADHLLLLAGHGAAQAAVAELAEAIAPGRVRLLGSVQDTAPVYAAADLALLTSISEGMPGTLIEAGLTGIPAVTTAVGAAPEVVQHGVSGAVVPAHSSAAEVADAIRQVLADGDAMGAAARHRCATRYELAHVADAWDGLLTEASLLPSKRTAP